MTEICRTNPAPPRSLAEIRKTDPRPRKSITEICRTSPAPPRSLAETRKTNRTTPDEDPEIPAHLKGPDLARFLEELNIRRDRGLPD
jgi:hypothetical protein